MLVRVRSQIPAIEAALRARGLPVEVVGLGGLLDTPRGVATWSHPAVLADPTAGAALLRLLTGPRWRIGPRDLALLDRRPRTSGGTGGAADDTERRRSRRQGDPADVAPWWRRSTTWAARRTPPRPGRCGPAGAAPAAPAS